MRSSQILVPLLSILTLASGCAIDFDAQFQSQPADAQSDASIDRQADARQDLGVRTDRDEWGQICFGNTKWCGGRCVDEDDPAFGCAPNTCAPCASPNLEASCEDDECVLECPVGFADCNHNAVDGCETPTTTLTNCGRCGHQCGPNATCQGKTCVVLCPSGYGDCNGDSDDGCETDLSSDRAHCGSCETPCNGSSELTLCVKGKCETCVGNSANCNHDPGDGCETDLLVDPMNCGQCHVACTASAGMGSCKDGSCMFSCEGAGLKICSGKCVDTLTDRENCGECDQSCGSLGLLPHGSGKCVNGQCMVGGCEDGWGDCNFPNFLDGCETSLYEALGNCGACGRQCSEMGVAKAYCEQGVCQPECVGGTYDCNTPMAPEPDDGCESTTACGGSG